MPTEQPAGRPAIPESLKRILQEQSDKTRQEIADFLAAVTRPIDSAPPDIPLPAGVNRDIERRLDALRRDVLGEADDRIESAKREMEPWDTTMPLANKKTLPEGDDHNMPWTITGRGTGSDKAKLRINDTITNRIIWHGHGEFYYAGGLTALSGGSESVPQRIYAAMLWDSPNTISIEVSNADVESDPITAPGGKWRGLVGTGYINGDGNAVKVSQEHRGAFHVYTLG